MSGFSANKIYESVCKAIEAFNTTLPEERRLNPSWQSRLVGSDQLDSLDVVNLVAAVEQRIEEDLGCFISLLGSDNRIGVEGFVTVEALVNYISHTLGQTKVLE